MKIKKQKSIFIAWFAIILVFILSVSSYRLIPFGEPDGLDFHNIYAYSTCDKELKEKFDNNIYLAGGQDCHDAMGREFVYPPLLFFSAKWVGEFNTFESARLAWRVLIVLGSLLSIYIWLGSFSNFFKILPFTGLLLIQFPMIFALERGNNDILVLLTWTFSYLFFSKERYTLSGFFASICVLMKIYPLFAFSVIYGGLIFSSLSGIFQEISDSRKEVLKRFSLGSLFAGILVAIMFRELWYSWYLRVSHFSDHQMVISYFNHSIQYFSKIKVFGKIIFLTMMGVWGLHFIYADKRKRAVSFAGALAITTYYSSVSFDYNQITIYPLILLTILSLLNNFEWKRYWVLLILLSGIILHRGLFIWGIDLGYKFHMFLQVFSLCMFALIDLPLWRAKHYFKFYKLKKELL